MLIPSGRVYEFGARALAGQLLKSNTSYGMGHARATPARTACAPQPALAICVRFQAALGGDTGEWGVTPWYGGTALRERRSVAKSDVAEHHLSLAFVVKHEAATIVL
eukprot:50623-Prymnesium_polylepis.1